MKFLRLRIANYRGITASEVRFSAVGITLVQGPNEVGKTSLGEAIGLLFEYPDSSKHRDVEAIRPVHRDEGPEIELQAESGPYAFTYFNLIAFIFHCRKFSSLINQYIISNQRFCASAGLNLARRDMIFPQNL